MRGLPFDSKTSDVVKFLAEFKVSDSDCVLEIRNGRMTGMAVAFLENETQRNDSIRKLNKKLIG